MKGDLFFKKALKEYSLNKKVKIRINENKQRRYY